MDSLKGTGDPWTAKGDGRRGPTVTERDICSPAGLVSGIRAWLMGKKMGPQQLAGCYLHRGNARGERRRRRRRSITSHQAFLPCKCLLHDLGRLESHNALGSFGCAVSALGRCPLTGVATRVQVSELYRLPSLPPLPLRL